jgi:hypothetical protein
MQAEYVRKFAALEAADPGYSPNPGEPTSDIPLFNHLYGLGSQWPKDNLHTHIGRTRRLRVVWNSWCDQLYTNFDGIRVCVVMYIGTGLTAAQKKHVIRNSELGHAVDGKDGWGIIWFGSVMHEGLRGYVLSKRTADGVVSEQKVVVFATDVEIEEGVPEIHLYDVSGDVKISDIRVLSDGSLMLSTKTTSTNTNSILNVPDLKQLRQYLSSGSLPGDLTQVPYTSRNPPVCVSNATSTTVLDANGKVWTATKDPRYPKTLGRPYEGSSDFATIPYLSETIITKVVSGGYMTAAVSSDGELFLWGQACPGSTGELRVLSGNVEGTMSNTGVSAIGEQDEYVQCLEISIDGEEARAHDVAIGHGHILVAAEVQRAGMETIRAVFAAGDNSKNQLGLGATGEFRESFEEIVAWRGRRVAQLMSGGWTSFTVMAED